MGEPQDLCMRRRSCSFSDLYGLLLRHNLRIFSTSPLWPRRDNNRDRRVLCPLSTHRLPHLGGILGSDVEGLKEEFNVQLGKLPSRYYRATPLASDEL